MRTIALLLSCSALACSTTATTGKPVDLKPSTAPAPAEFKAKGTLISWQNSVSYDDHRIVGPNVDIALQNGTEWAGTAYGHNVRLAVVPGSNEIGGTGAKLAFTRTGNTVHVEGQWDFRRVRIDVAPDHFLIRDALRTFDLTQKGPGCYGEPQREGCIVKMMGDAAKMPDAAMPQFAIAAIAVFGTNPERP